jgi:ParB family chromosome partitioning protein
VVEVDASAVLQAAKSVKGRDLNARAVFQALINLPEKEFTRVNYPVGIWNESAKKISIEIEKLQLSGQQLQELKDFIGSLKPNSSPE